PREPLVADEQDEDRRRGRGREGDGRPERRRRQDRQPVLPRSAEGSESLGQRRGRLAERLLAKEEGKPREVRVGVHVVELEGRVVGPRRAIETAARLRQAPLERRGPREIGEPVNSDRLRRLLELPERRRGSAGVVLQVRVQELEPARAVETAGHRRRERRRELRDRLLSEDRRRHEGVGGGEEEERGSGNGKRESKRHETSSGFRFPFSDYRPRGSAPGRVIST